MIQCPNTGPIFTGLEPDWGYLPYVVSVSMCLGWLSFQREGVSQKAVSRHVAKVGHIVSLLEDLCLGVSFRVSPKKIALGTRQGQLLGLHGGPCRRRCTRALSCLLLLLWDRADTRCLWQMLLLEHLNHCPNQTVFLERSHSENIRCP